MRWSWCILGAVIGGLAVLFVAPMVVAEVDGPMADVIHGDRLSAKVAEGGDVQVVPMKRGEWGYMGEFQLEPGTSLEAAPRGEEEYLYVLSGRAVLSVDDRRFLVGPRMGVYLPTGSEVSWTNGPEQLVAVQFFAGGSPGGDYDEWEEQDDDVTWPRPRLRPRPAPSEVSER